MRGVTIGVASLCLGLGWGLGVATHALLARRAQGDRRLSSPPVASARAPAPAGAAGPEEAPLDRGWQREVRGRALLALREEAAQMGQRYLARVKALELRHQDEDVSFGAARRALQERTEEWNDYVRSGRFDLARLQVTDPEVLDAAEALMADLQARAPDLRPGDAERLREERDATVRRLTALQLLINRKLEAL